MISFKGKHYPKDVILFAVFFCVRYAVSYHDLEEIRSDLYAPNTGVFRPPRC